MFRRKLVAVVLAFASTGIGVVRAGTEATNGFFDSYLLLGPYQNPGGADPGQAAQSEDYLCDLDGTSEQTIVPEAGLVLNSPDVGGCAYAQTAWLGTGAPTIQLVSVADGELNIDTAIDPAVDNDNVMAYAWVYVENVTNPPRVLNYILEMGSDDGIAVDVDRLEVWNHSLPRGSAAGVIDDRVPVTLLPGPNLLQFKVFEGGGGWNMRARLQSSTACGIAFSGAGEIVVSTTPPAGEIPELPIVASRSIAFAEQSSARTVVDVAVAVVATGNYGLRETFGTGWTASNPVPGGATISAGSIEWTGITAATVTYRLTRATGYTAAQARIDGTATAAGVAAQVGGTASIPTASVREALLSPAFTMPVGGCDVGPAEIDGNWIGGGGVTDANIVPSEGYSWTPAWGTAECQATGLTQITNNAAFWTVPGDPVASDPIVVRVVSDAAGLFNFNDVIYAGDPETTMCVAWFYLDNVAATRVPVWMSTGSDDAIGVRVNGHVVFTGDFCRGNPGFADKIGTTLDPGKNLVAVYTYEQGGGFNMNIRLEDENGRPKPFDITLDPSGYDPADHAAPPDAVPVHRPAYTDLGFVTQFLVPADPLDQGLGATTIAGAASEDYITINGEVPDASSVLLGAPANAGSTGRITTGIRGGNACGFTPLVLFDGFTSAARTEGDPGLFNGELFYGSPDNYSSSLFFFLDNKTTADRSVWIGFASDDAATLFVNGELVSEYLVGRGYGDANTIQDPGRMEAVLRPGLNLVQLSYTEGGGGSGARVAVFGDVCGTRFLDPDAVEVTANPGGTPTVTADRSLGKVDCDGNATVTLTFRVLDGPKAVSLIENLPPGSTGSNPSRGTFNAARTQLTFSGSVSEGDTLTYSIVTQPGAAYCAATANGEPVTGQRVFRANTDLCGDPADGIYINCGGAATTDALGRAWLEDSIGNPSNYLTSPNLYTAAWGFVPNLTADPLVAQREYPADVFNAERWNDGPIEYTVTKLPAGRYEVVILFMDGCCSDGCAGNLADVCDAVRLPPDGQPPAVDPADPANVADVTDPPDGVADGCRVFDVYVNDILVADQFCQNAVGACLAGTVPGAASNGIGVTIRHEAVVSDGTLKVRVQDLGAGSPPENAAIKGVAILPAGGGGEPQFRRGDANADGGMNITDGIYVLNYLFLGGETPTCLDAADSNGDNALNITDGIFILNYLFLGGETPPAPGPDACGLDPDEDPDQTCESYTAC